MDRFEGYRRLALNMGAVDAVYIAPGQLVFDGRVLLKCMFGCPDWGKGCTCPSRDGALKPWEYEPLLRKYDRVLLIHAHDKFVTQKAAFEIERQAFFDGDPLALASFDCAWCESCAGLSGKPCNNPKKARPALHSFGIDLFATVKPLGLPLYALKTKDEEQNWYSGVFLN